MMSLQPKTEKPNVLTKAFIFKFGKKHINEFRYKLISGMGKCFNENNNECINYLSISVT